MTQHLWLYIPWGEFIDDIIEEEAMLVPLGEFLGDITAFDSPQAVRDQWAKKYPDDKPEKYAGICSALYRMAHEVKDDDVIVMPTLEHDGMIHVGFIVDDYLFECDDIELNGAVESMELCIHVRELEWLAHYPQSDFKPDMLKSVEGNESLFLQRLKQDAFFRELVKKLNEDIDEDDDYDEDDYDDEDDE